MTREEAKARLHALNQAIATAVLLIKSEKEVLDRFFVEAPDFDSIVPILDPTLWGNSERRAAEALLKPVYEAARDLVQVYDTQCAKGRDALAKARG